MNERENVAHPSDPEDDSARDKAQVNPAARRDHPDQTPPAERRREAEEQQVPPVQEEPLDPLGPGGIGA